MIYSEIADWRYPLNWALLLEIRVRCMHGAKGPTVKFLSCQTSATFSRRLDWRILEHFLFVSEILHNEGETPVAKQVGVADEEEFDLEFDRLSEFHSLECAGAN